MTERPYRVLFVASHPVQYQAPLFRRLAAHPELDAEVAYCSLRGAEAGYDPEFEARIQWDIPLLDGYRWIRLQNRGSGDESFFGLFNPRVWWAIRTGEYDAVVCFTGYLRATFWIAYAAARLSKSAFLFGGDATSLAPRDGQAWKPVVKKYVWPLLFGLADQVIVPSSATRDFMLKIGIPRDRVTLTPYVVDNDWWKLESRRVCRDAIRRSWGVGPGQAVVLYCAKLQPWKRPQDLLRAFAKAAVPGSVLVFAGEGGLRSHLEEEAVHLGIAQQVRFLGFVNQRGLPAAYTSADILVLPSQYEPFGVVVNEAMCCGCPVIASDRVGAAEDLIAPLRPEFVFPCGDLETLANLLRKVLSDAELRRQMSQNARARMDTWSPAQNIEATVEAVRIAVSRKGRPASPPLSTIRHALNE